jgi:putative ABC transport system substrate-binding protein
MSHPALDAVIANMKAELKNRGYVEGQNIVYVEKNANGDPNAAVTIVRELQLNKPDVLVAVTTPVAQVAVKNLSIPVVFSAVTDPVGAGVVTSLSSPPNGITGVSDAWPYEAQLSLAREISPNAKRLGVLFNPGEAASQYGIKQIRNIAPRLGFSLVEIPVSNSQEIVSALRARIRGVDAVYLSSDNTVIEGMPAALRACMNAKKPLFVGDAGTVEKGGLAAVSVGYPGVGRATGQIVDSVLRGAKSIQVRVLQGDEIYLNANTARTLGITFPDTVLKRATRVIGAQ